MSKSMKSQPYLESIQYGIFFSKPLDRLDKLITPITDKYSDVFDTQPTIFPFIEGLDEVVTAQAGSTNTQWQLNISRKRADIIYTPLKDKQYRYENLTSENNKIQEMILAMADIVRDLEDHIIKISRITNISTFIFECDNPEQQISTLFLEDKNNTYKDLIIRFNNPIEENSIKYNNLKYYEGVIDPSTDIRALRIQNDFNTDISKNTLTNEEIKEFWNITQKYSHHIPELE